MITWKQFRKYYSTGGSYVRNRFVKDGLAKTQAELAKAPSRAEVINFILSTIPREHTIYVEIGVRNPADNFDRINAGTKYSVDPGVEFKENPVDFKLTSDEFFEKLRRRELLNPVPCFDVIFVDGLHQADQVERDIRNALEFVADDGFIVLHDCNPPTQWHAREEYYYNLTPAGVFWNGTTWKAYYRQRLNPHVSCVCVDTDWGVGVITKKPLAEPLKEDINPYFEFDILDKHRAELLNLVSFDSFKQNLSSTSHQIRPH